MSKKTVPVSVDILGTHFRLGCPASEQKRLQQAADMVSQRMLEVKEDGRVLGMDRIAVMTALNVACELLTIQQQECSEYEKISRDHKHQTTAVEQHIQRLQQQLANGLTEELEQDSTRIKADNSPVDELPAS